MEDMQDGQIHAAIPVNQKDEEPRKLQPLLLH